MRRPTFVLGAIALAVVAFAFILRSAEGPPEAITTTTSVVAATTSTTVVGTTTTLAPGVQICDLYTDITVAGTVASNDLVEASGLAASRVHPGVFWSHNDSRGSATLFALSASGEDLGVFDVPGALSFDWEDMSAGPGPEGEGAYLYVGDIGDNFDIRGGLVTVYRVVDTDPGALEDSFPESIPLTYRFPDDSTNAEALFVDPIEPSLYLLTKDRTVTLVFRGPLTPSNGPMDLELVATLPLDAEVSAADMDASGTTLALRGYQNVWMWHRDTSTPIVDMLLGEPCLAPAPDERQGEAITFDSDGSYWTLSEGTNESLHFVERR